MEPQPPTRTDDHSGGQRPTFPDIAADARRLRDDSVDGHVSRRLNQRDGCATDTDIEQWAEQGGKLWDQLNPALSGLLRYLDSDAEVSG